jgi:hypothetical protein
VDRQARPHLSPRNVLLLVDVEPDARKTDRDGDGWAGARAAHDHLERLRAALSERTGTPARFNWFLRADPQVRDTWGSADRAAGACPAIIRAIEEHGDHCGIHPHLWRWSDRLGDWFNDIADPDWVAECLGTSVEAYRRIFGRDPESCRFGDRWLDAGAIRLMERAGIRFDLTVEPGLPGAAVHDDPHATGRLPDYRRAPRVPYQPADGAPLLPRREPADDGLWIIPVTTTPPAWRMSRRPPFVVRDSRSPNLSLWPGTVAEHLLAETARPAPEPLVIVFRAGDVADPVHLANFRETTDRWLASPALGACEFTDPATAVARWRGVATAG